MMTERVNVGVLPVDAKVIINTILHRTSNEFKIISKTDINSVLYVDNLDGVPGRRFFDVASITSNIPESVQTSETIFQLEFTDRLETILANENNTFVIKNPDGINVTYGGVGTYCSGGCTIIGCFGCGTSRGCGRYPFTHIPCYSKVLLPGTYGCNNTEFIQVDATREIYKQCYTYSTGFHFYKITPIQNCKITYQDEYINNEEKPKFII